ncbi:hypothetical protein [Streptomyces virginiae]
MARFGDAWRSARAEAPGPRTRYDRVVAPDDKFMEPGRPAKQNLRANEDTRMYRRARVRAS